MDNTVIKDSASVVEKIIMGTGFGLMNRVGAKTLKTEKLVGTVTEDIRRKTENDWMTRDRGLEMSK